MKHILALLIVGLSVPAMAKPDCSKAAADAAKAEFAKLVAPLAVDDGVWVAKTTRKGTEITYLIEVSAADNSCRDCYYAAYYNVTSSASTCEVRSVNKN